MAERPITFPKTSDGVWTNRETGVIIRIELDGSGYRPMRPTPRGSWIGISLAKRTPADAKNEAARYIRDSLRYTMGRAYVEAVAEHIDRSETAAKAAGTVGGSVRFNDARAKLRNFAIYSDPYWLDAAIREITWANKWTAEVIAANTQQCTATATGSHSFQYDPDVIDEHEGDADWMRCGRLRDDQVHDTARAVVALIDAAEREIAERECTAVASSAHPFEYSDHENRVRESHPEWAWCGQRRDAEVHQPPADITPDTRFDLTERGRDYLDASAVIEDARTTEGIAGAPMRAPADVDDHEAWAQYVATLPAPTDDEIAAVIAEFASPYREQIEQCRDGLHADARLIQHGFRGGWLTIESSHHLRDTMRTYLACIRNYQQLALTWARTARNA